MECSCLLKSTQRTLPQRQKPEKMDLEVIEVSRTLLFHHIPSSYVCTLYLTSNSLTHLQRLATLLSTIESQHKDILFKAPARTEGGTGAGLYAREELPSFNPAAKKLGCEMAHVHPYDNSLHVYLSPSDARKVIEAEWGQRFPVKQIAPPSWVSGVRCRLLMLHSLAWFILIVWSWPRDAFDRCYGECRDYVFFQSVLHS